MSDIAKDLVKGLATRMFNSAVAPIERKSKHVARCIVFGVMGGVLVCVALGFATAAGYIWLRSRFDPAIASLVVAALYLCVALLCFIAITTRAEATPSQASIWGGGPSRSSPQDRLQEVSDSAQSISDALHLDQIKPHHLAMLAVIGGYILGRQLDKKSK